MKSEIRMSNSILDRLPREEKINQIADSFFELQYH